jgi:capsular exopolysaccharide synthesis family protein
MAEAFRKLRTSIQFADLDHPIQTLLITSALPTDGKSFIAANLATVIAQSGKSVILIDADLRHPVLHEAFGLPKTPGLLEALLAVNEDGDPLATLQETQVRGLRLLTAGAHTPNPAEVLSSQTFRQFVTQLTEQVDFVIFDSPPVLAVTDAVVLSNLTDGTLMVIDYGVTRIPAAVQAMQRLTEVSSGVLGTVLNRVPPGGDGYYYYQYYYYGTESQKKPGVLNQLLQRDKRRRS